MKSPAFLDRPFNLCIICIIVSIVVYVGLQPYINTLPDNTALAPELKYEPLQIPVEPKQYSVISEKKEYIVQTHFLYEQYGLVVSSNNKTVFNPLFKLINSRDYLNVNDLCVIWGYNVQSGVYKDMTFSQGAYTCYAKADKDANANTVYTHFQPQQIGHNHILTNDRKLKKMLRQVRAGDQIRLTGLLSSYYHNGQLIRRSSFSRNDTLCETIFLTDFLVMNKHRPILRGIATVCGWITLIAGVLAIYFQVQTQKRKHKNVRWGKHPRY